MRSVLLAAALALTASAAAAQGYPPCSHPGQDRCVQGGHMMRRHDPMRRPHGRHHRHAPRPHHRHHR